MMRVRFDLLDGHGQLVLRYQVSIQDKEMVKPASQTDRSLDATIRSREDRVTLDLRFESEKISCYTHLLVGRSHKRSGTRLRLVAVSIVDFL